KVWKEPGFFLAHPDAIAAFGRECTRRGVPPPTVSLFGSQFITWRGIPLIPSNKIPVEDGKTKILLLRVGEKRQGIVGLFQRVLRVNSHRGFQYALWESTVTRLRRI
ncbi:major membrane I domain protein, partial [Acinetobacter baumannii]